MSAPCADLIKQISIDYDHPEKCVRVGTGLPYPIKTELILFLRENVVSFALFVADMQGIKLKVTCNELNVDPTFKPIKQKR